MMHHRFLIRGAVLLSTTPTCYIHAFLSTPTLPSTQHLSLSYSTALSMNKRAKRKPSSGGSGGFGKKRVITNNIRTKKSNKSNFVYAGDIRPHEQSPTRIVDPDSVLSIPDYALTGNPKKKGSQEVEVKSEEAIAKMRAAGRAAREVLDIAGRLVKEGVTTDEIDAAVHEASIERKCYPSPLNYRNFPKSCCTSVNEVICHGIPDMRKLKAGEIINIDITVYLDGYHGDCSEMFVVGGRDALDERGQELIQTTYDCWVQSMQLVKAGNDFNVIGNSIQEYVTSRGFSTVRSFCGHGIGDVFHCSPNIFHYTINQSLGTMKAGNVFTIEPMICEKLPDPYMWPDDWTATTVDGGRSAQFEHTLLVTEDGVEALTGKLESSPIQWWEEESTIKQGIFLGTSESAKAREDELNKSKLVNK